MSKSRKILGALLAVIMVFSVVSVSAFAAGTTHYESAEDYNNKTYTQSWYLDAPQLVSGSTYKVNVRLTTNYKVGPISFKLEGVTAISSAVPGNGYYQNCHKDISGGWVLFTPVVSGSTGVSSLDMNNAIVAVVTYTTSNANGAVTIENNPKSTFTPNGTLVAARCTEDTLNGSDFYVGQYAEVDGAAVTPPAGDVTLTGINGAVVDGEKKYVYGIPANTSNVTTYLQTTGHIVVEANAAGSTKGTGALIKLYESSSASTPVATYTLVIFGDVNGDGFVKGDDASIIASAANYVTAALTGVEAFAADINADGFAKGDDASTIASYANFVVPTITVNPWA
jgi:hypothetical protein